MPRLFSAYFGYLILFTIMSFSVFCSDNFSSFMIKFAILYAFTGSTLIGIVVKITACL